MFKKKKKSLPNYRNNRYTSHFQKKKVTCIIDHLANPSYDLRFKLVSKIHTAIILSQTVPGSRSTKITRTHRGNKTKRKGKTRLKNERLKVIEDITRFSNGIIKSDFID